ncbi:hypothetical protein EVAR_51452_1 [Eumeta japonica]|uniref:Uncharacterized protein n=1 Tax=Eumeta variegata TaxID=151549 RepID=A0A4C1XR95_EUMVA|nr:hypothetical protein EVAR_51452_1 [Eumeta japonica]
MSCLKDKPKPIFPAKKLDVIFRRRNVPNSQYYFTNRKHALTFRKPIKPYVVPRTEKILSFIKYTEEKTKVTRKETLNKPVHEKDNVRLAQSRGIADRLLVEDPPDDVKVVLEIHPEFYGVIEGRPLRSADDIKVYISNLRTYAMSRQQIGYRRDLVLKIGRSMHEEESEFEEIFDNYKGHVKNFQRFLTEDYMKASAKVAAAENVYRELDARTTEYLGYVSKITLLNNILFKLDAIRGVLKLYRSFLLYVAPITWRQEHDERLQKKTMSIDIGTVAFSTNADVLDSVDVDVMIELASMELKDPPPSHLYFTEPDQMLYLFRTMELQSREYLTQLAVTDGPFRMVSKKIKELKESTKRELDYFQYYINRIEIDINRELHNEKHLQERIFKILNGSFYESVASPETLRLKICVEFVYEQVFGHCEEGHHNIQGPMTLLEVMYEEYNSKLDHLDFKIVKQAQIDFFARDLKMMKKAYMAQRELKAFAEMTNAMNKAFLPPAKFVRPTIGKFERKVSEVVEQKELTDEEKFRSLTQDEKDGLLYFTNFCQGKDPAPYLKDYYNYIEPVFR